MLTWAALEALVAEGCLIRWSPNGDDPPAEGRALYMTPDVFAAITKQPWPSSGGEMPRHTQQRRSAMRQVLERFVKGLHMLIQRDIKELGSVSPLRSHMRGFWEIRSQGRMEETRLFGFFARPGAFVATGFKGRGEFEEQADWDAQRCACEQQWQFLAGNEKYLAEPWPITTRSQLAKYVDRNEE